MKKDPLVLLSHIIESIQLIEEYTKGVTQVQFVKDVALQDAIIRRLEIIGEAVKGLSAAFKVQYSDLPWKQMAGMRDILIHEYLKNPALKGIGILRQVRILIRICMDRLTRP